MGGGVVRKSSGQSQNRGLELVWGLGVKMWIGFHLLEPPSAGAGIYLHGRLTNAAGSWHRCMQDMTT